MGPWSLSLREHVAARNHVVICVAEVERQEL